MFTVVSAQPQQQIPQWVKNNAGWWAQGSIDDSDFVLGIQHLIKNGVVQVSVSKEDKRSESSDIPTWIRNNADWWSKGLISDSDFIKGIEYLVNNGIIQTSAKHDLCKGDTICTHDTVTRVIDGDTIYTSKYKIRISLADTPESNEKGYVKATEFTRNLCPVGTTVLIDQDDLQRYDVYGRLLGAVYCDGKLLNSELLYNGHAKISTAYCSASEFSGEPWAQKFGCASYEKPKTSSSLVPETNPKSLDAKTESKQEIKEESKCDASYPDFCIPPPPPDLDCKDVPYKKFRVLPPDPHRFDGDKDGIGCE